MAGTSKIARRRRQSGAAIVEFAFVLPILLMLTYGTIVYSYLFIVRQALSYAAAEGARSALSVSLLAPSYDTAVDTQAKATVTSALSWMPATTKSSITQQTGFCGGSSGSGSGSSGVTCPTDGGSAVVVTLTLPLTTSASPLFRKLTIPGVGSFPPLPGNMTAAAVVRI